MIIESIEFMDGIADIYMPDFKFWSPERSKRYMKAEDYPIAARRAIRAKPYGRYRGLGLWDVLRFRR
jgi:uncharacterized Fe-S radical SAM superfamily protein PflX